MREAATDRSMRRPGRRGARPALTIERRLAAVEAALTMPPLDRLARAVSDGARSRAKDRSADERIKAIDTAVSETVFRFRLVLRIITVTCEELDGQLLLEALDGTRLGLLLTTDRFIAKRDPGYLADLIQVRDLIVGRVDELLLAAGEARATVEPRYLSGPQALFPKRQAEWSEQVLQTQRLGAMAIGLTDKVGVAPPTPPEPEVTASRVERLVADLVEPARADALEDLGQGRRAFGTAASWVRCRLVDREVLV